MTSTTLYIPKTITVGFQKRSDTFTGKLGYVIYTDHTGKLRKEGSWNGWRDHKIEPVTVDNVPTPNFTLNKGVQRSREWFGTGRSMVRVWDPRDFEFEISVDNLLNVLMHADVSKRDITESCVYAWQGTNLILLPTNSLEYQESIKHTEKQGKKFSARDLVPGYTYSLKESHDGRVVYLGRFERFTVDSITEDGERSRYSSHYSRGVKQTLKGNKGHAFIDPKTLAIYIKDPSKYVHEVMNEEVHPDFASFMDKYYASVESQRVKGVVVDTNLSQVSDDAGYYSWYNWDWFEWKGNYVELSIGSYDHAVDINRIAKYDDTNTAVLMSHEGSSGRSYYYTSRSIAPYNPTSLRANDPELVAHLAKMREAFRAFFPERGAIRDHAESQRLSNAAHRMLAEKFNVGQLKFVLADGKIAHDHRL